MELKKQKQ